jgi:hypothetical protein
MLYIEHKVQAWKVVRLLVLNYISFSCNDHDITSKKSYRESGALLSVSKKSCTSFYTFDEVLVG